MQGKHLTKHSYGLPSHCIRCNLNIISPYELAFAAFSVLCKHSSVFVRQKLLKSSARFLITYMLQAVLLIEVKYPLALQKKTNQKYI